ncbi:MAG: DUF2809 domain-containing protein [Chloroflexota bacterium]
MMPQPTFVRSRLLYAGLITLVIAIGLPTRLIPEIFPAFVVDYLGDALWALAIFLLIGLLLPTKRTRTIFWIALAVTWGIEFSELYQADWINAIRAYKLGGLILGYTFLPSDLLMYLCGIGAGVLLEKWIFSDTRASFLKSYILLTMVVALLIVVYGVIAFQMLLPLLGFPGGSW